MPELPDITVYIEALERRILGQTLEQIRLISPFLLRTVSPRPSELAGKRVTGLRRLGKRIAIGLEGDCSLVIHLMIAGRLRWLEKGGKVPGRIGLAAFDFANGTLVLTEAGSKRRASLHIVCGPAIDALDRGGLEVLTATEAQFGEALRRENHTMKRTLTDPRLFSGIGNAYSDEILHRAQLSPVQLSRNLDDAEVARLFEATRFVLIDWTDRLRAEAGGEFPKDVTAFRAGMAAHGRYKLPCPVCGTAIQRIVHASNETNYCPRCQTGGKLLSDRSLARLLKDDWPKTIDELEKRQSEQLEALLKPS